MNPGGRARCLRTIVVAEGVFGHAQQWHCANLADMATKYAAVLSLARTPDWLEGRHRG
jgi:hypothetical protein